MMGEAIHIRTNYTQHDGVLVTDKGTKVSLGREDGTVAPYELLLGGLSYCLFRTFESVSEKMKAEYAGMDMEITGVKGDDKIGMLTNVDLTVSVTGAADEKKITKAFEIATRYCSVFNTLGKIAEMKWEISFHETLSV